MSPKGNKYSGVPGGVVIDSYTSKDYGGNGQRTGDFKIHIAGADGVYKDLGWVRLSQISGYENGTERVDKDQIALVNENMNTKHHGVSEMIYRDGSVLVPLKKDDSVIPADMVSKMMATPMEFGSFGTNAANVIYNSIPQNISNAGNVTYHYDALLNIENVEGNLDKSALPGLQEILEKSYQYTSKQIVKDARKVGIRPSR